MSNQQSRKVLAQDVTSTKKKTSNKLFGNSSSNKDFPRKNRLIQQGFVTEKSRFIDDVLVDRHQKCVQTNIVTDEHSYSRWKAINRSDGSDVVSFTFTSPMMKPMSGNQFSMQSVEKLDEGNMYCFDTCNQKNDENANDKNLSSHGLNIINGDALGLLLEQKLRELTYGDEPSYVGTHKDDSFTASSTVSDLDTIDSDSVEHRDQHGGVYGYGVSSIDGHVFGASKLQAVEEWSSSSGGGREAKKELEHQNASTFSILEASSSNDTFYLTESSDSTDGK